MSLSKLASASGDNAESPIKDYDTLLAELSAPTHNAERYTEAGQGAYQKKTEKQTDIDPDTFDPDETETSVQKMDPEKAMREGRRLAKMVDSGLSLGASLIAKNNSAAPYKASPGDIDDLSEAWSEIAQEYNIKVNPWIKLVFLNGSTYLPVYMKAFNDRRFKLMELEQEAMKLRQDALEKKLKNMETAKNATETTAQSSDISS